MLTVDHPLTRLNKQLGIEITRHRTYLHGKGEENADDEAATQSHQGFGIGRQRGNDDFLDCIAVAQIADSAKRLETPKQVTEGWEERECEREEAGVDVRYVMDDLMPRPRFTCDV